MNTELEQNRLSLTSSPVTFFAGGLPDKQTKMVSFPAVLSLEEMLERVNPLPQTSLFFGQAEDERPILLDLTNPRPGPILIAGDPGAGKTRLLRVLARFIVSMRQPREIQYGVITSCPDEWNDLTEFPHCVGIFPMQEKRASTFLQALAMWTDMKTRNHQSFVLMIDGLDEFTALNHAAGHEVHKILVEGPAKRIWPAVTIDPNRYRLAGAWLKYFHTRVFGYTRCASISDDPFIDFESLAKGIEFSMKTMSRRIKFRIPRI
jgi:hypothetical protein